jgi:hypothetical protein
MLVPSIAAQNIGLPRAHHSHRPRRRTSAAEMQALHLIKHEVCPQWNYTIEPSYLWN